MGQAWRGTAGTEALRQDSFANHTQPCRATGEGYRGTREGWRGRQRPQIKGLGYRAKEEPRLLPRTRTKDRIKLTSGLPRFWPLICQLGAMLRAQHAQPRGRSVHQRGGHSVWCGPGASGQWLPNVTGKKKIRHRYAPFAASSPGAKPHPLLLSGSKGWERHLRCLRRISGCWGVDTQDGGHRQRGMGRARWRGVRRKIHVSGLSPGGQMYFQGSNVGNQKPHYHATLTPTPFSCPHRGCSGPWSHELRGVLRRIGDPRVGTNDLPPPHCPTSTGMYLVSC